LVDSKNVVNQATEYTLTRRGVMLALSSPSGAGKTTISRHLMREDENIITSISATTRKIRPGEVEGVHYYFKTAKEFDAMIENDEFLEYAEVFGNMYGTPHVAVEKYLIEGKDIFFDVDWQGTRRIADKAPHDIVSIYILPPSLPELKNRLVKRGQDSAEIIESRMSKAVSEISHYDEYHYVIVNHDIDESIYRVKSILEAERIKRRRITGLDEFVKNLQV